MHRFIAAMLLFFLPGMVLALSEEQKLKELGEKVKAVEAKQHSVERGMRSIDERTYAIRQDMDRMEANIEKRKKLLRQYGTLINQYQASLAETKKLLQNKTVGFYKGAYLDMVDFSFSHAELGGYLEASVARDKQALLYYMQVSRMKQAAKKGLEEQTKALNQELSQIEGRMKELNAEREKKRVLLASLQQESFSYQNEIERLMERIRAREKEQKIEYTGIARYKGDLPWPVKGEVVRRFGKYAMDGVVQISQGLDIQTEDGAEVKSIFKGKVVYMGWIDRYGYTLIVDHGGGYYSIYAHVRKALKKEGEEIAAQDAIALAGQSGNVLNPTLHFEIRYHGKAQDPKGWLKK
jgi:septal ring factor EnvC (AmiA/AmiB activator)